MTEGKWVLAKIAAVHLRLPDVSDDLALLKLLTTEAEFIARRCSRCACGKTKIRANKARKQDVSNEPRIPAGQSGGGEWTTGDGAEAPSANASIVPVQAEVLPFPGTLPIPLELPDATEVTPTPLELPGTNLQPRPPFVNPYPNKRKCVEEWEDAFEFCKRQLRAGKLKPGYSGFGKDFASCVLGQVSEECGGNPAA